MFDIAQPSLFGGTEPVIDKTFASCTRLDLADGAWVDYAPGWCAGDEALFATLVASGEWSSPEVVMFDNKVVTPRLTSSVSPGWHPVIGEMIDVLSARYRKNLNRVSAALYRDGRDSVAWHGDRVARNRREATVATVSLGTPRRFLLRPASGGESIGYALGSGDLVVMGGSCQRTWRHSVPKSANAGPRIALMFRHAYD